MTLADLRIACLELLPPDANRREEASVHLAFVAQADLVPALAAAAEEAIRRPHKPLKARIAHAIKTGELRAGLDADREATRLRLLFDGLAIQVVTTPPRRRSTKWAVELSDEHLAALR